MANNVEAVSSSLNALTQQYETITNNLSNASSVGYKRRTSLFEETMQNLVRSGGVTAKSPVDFTQGPLIQTGRPLDLAINGEGFFVVETPDGKLYTRNGTLTTNKDGQLVDSVGRMVAGENGPLTVPKTASLSQINVSSEGAVSANGQNIGKLRIVDFEDRSALKPVGTSSYTAPDSVEPKAAAPAKFSVSQGAQEASNVNIVKELVSLIVVSRQYEANLKTLSTQDDRMKNLMQVAMA